MDGFPPPTLPVFEIRRLLDRKYVIDVHWPFGGTEQLIGVFESWQDARHWLSTDAPASVRPASPLDVQQEPQADNDN
jgi:hypothetical protein